jgi:hypothetical protein
MRDGNTPEHVHHYCKCFNCGWQFGFKEDNTEVRCQRTGPGYPRRPEPSFLPDGFECPMCQTVGTATPCRDFLLAAATTGDG